MPLSGEDILLGIEAVLGVGEGEVPVLGELDLAIGILEFLFDNVKKGVGLLYEGLELEVGVFGGGLRGAEQGFSVFQDSQEHLRAGSYTFRLSKHAYRVIRSL